MRLNVSQNVTRKTFKITRKYPPNNPQPHQENGASDATERLKIDNQVAGVNTVALTYGNCSASVRIFSVVILTMHHTKRGSVYHLPFVVISTMQPSHRHAKGIYHYQLYPSNPPAQRRTHKTITMTQDAKPRLTLFCTEPEYCSSLSRCRYVLRTQPLRFFPLVSLFLALPIHLHAATI